MVGHMHRIPRHKEVPASLTRASGIYGHADDDQGGLYQLVLLLSLLVAVPPCFFSQVTEHICQKMKNSARGYELSMRRSCCIILFSVMVFLRLLMTMSCEATWRTWYSVDTSPRTSRSSSHRSPDAE